VSTSRRAHLFLFQGTRHHFNWSSAVHPPPSRLPPVAGLPRRVPCFTPAANLPFLCLNAWSTRLSDVPPPSRPRHSPGASPPPSQKSYSPFPLSPVSLSPSLLWRSGGGVRSPLHSPSFFFFVTSSFAFDPVHAFILLGMGPPRRSGVRWRLTRFSFDLVFSFLSLLLTLEGRSPSLRVRPPLVIHAWLVDPSYFPSSQPLAGIFSQRLKVQDPLGSSLLLLF